MVAGRREEGKKEEEKEGQKIGVPGRIREETLHIVTDETHRIGRGTTAT